MARKLQGELFTFLGKTQVRLELNSWDGGSETGVERSAGQSCSG